MSHITQIKTELRSLHSIKSALRHLGYGFDLGGTVRDLSGVSVQVEVVVHIPGQRDVGFVRNEKTGCYDVVGDWWRSAITKEAFVESLKCRYAREQVIESLERQGVDVSKVREVEEPDGSVTFTVDLDDNELQSMISA